MANDLPTRLCEECGQIWSSGSFLDPTIKADCGFCGASLIHRRRLPDTLADELEQMSAANSVSATNGAGARRRLGDCRSHADSGGLEGSLAAFRAVNRTP